MNELRAVDTISLYNKFQPELKAWLESWQEQNGKLEKQTPVMLRSLLNLARTALVIPPWHEFTQFIKEVAKAAAAGELLSRQNSWFKHALRPTGCIPGIPIGTRTWVTVHAHVSRGEKKCTKDFIVGFYKDEDNAEWCVWDPDAESMLAKTNNIPVYLDPSKPRGSVGCELVAVNREKIIEFGAEVFGEGKDEGDLFWESKFESKAGLRRNSHAHKPEDKPEDKPAARPSRPPDAAIEGLSLADVEITEMLFERGIVDASNNGLNNTALRWQESCKRVVAAIKMLI